MRKTSMAATIVAMTVAGGLTIHAQATQTRPTQGTPQTRANSGQDVTVAGCLQDQPGTGSHAGMSGSTAGTTTPGSTGSGSGSAATAGATASGTASATGAARSNMGENFVLMNARIASGSSTSGMGSVSSFQIKGQPDAEMRKHVGHQIEVTGRLSSATGASMTGSSSATRPTTGSAGTTGATGTTGAGSTGATGSGSATGTTAQHGGSDLANQNMKDLPQIQATSIKMIAATCQAK